MEPMQGLALRLHGELDDDACAAFRRRLAPALSCGMRFLVLDVQDVTGLPLPGVRLLRSLDAHLGGLLLVHPTQEVLSTLRVFDLDHLLKVRQPDPPVARPVLPAKAPEQLADLLPLFRERSQTCEVVDQHACLPTNE